jgi:hypothetical protein
MLEQLLSTLQKEAGPQLISQLGLNSGQATSSVSAAVDSVKDVLGGSDGFGLDDVVNLFSSAKNTSGADGILSQIGNVMQGKLTGQAGLNASQAGGVKDMLLPMVTKLISDHVGGDAGKMQGLLGALGNGGGLADMAKGLLGNLFKK